MADFFEGLSLVRSNCEMSGIVFLSLRGCCSGGGLFYSSKTPGPPGIDNLRQNQTVRSKFPKFQELSLIYFGRGLRA